MFNPLSRNPLLPLAVMSGTLGFLIGMAYSTFQAAVEGAQVVAGIVQYPSPTPFWMYQVKVWTLLHQIPALLLRAGLTEAALSILLSGFMGMCSLLALTLGAYALTKNPWAALGVPFLIAATRTSDFGSVYGVTLWRTEATYSAVGLSYNFLVVALISLKRYRIGGFLLGLSPAVHPAQGVLYIVTAGLCFLANRKEWREAFQITRRYFLFGLLASAVSLGIHWAFTDRVTFFYPVESRQVHSFIYFYDSHRRAVSPFGQDVTINLAALALSLVWLRYFRKDLPDTAHFLLYAVAVTAMLGFIFGAITWLPLEKLPLAFVGMMPARILNFGVLGFALLIISLLLQEKRRAGVQLLAALFLPGLILVTAPPRNLPLLFLTTLALIFLKMIRSPGWTAVSLVKLQRHLPKAVRIIALAVFLLSFIRVVSAAYKNWTSGEINLEDWRTNSFFKTLSRGKGLLLMSSDFGRLQLLTRRAVLIDLWALDGLPYVPEAGHSMTTILREIYGFDLSKAERNPRSRRIGYIATDIPLWKSRSLEEWKRIGKKYKVQDVLATVENQLKLPVIASDGEFALYRIPEDNA